MELYPNGSSLNSHVVDKKIPVDLNGGRITGETLCRSCLQCNINEVGSL